MRLLALALALFSSTVNATVLFNFPPNAAVGTSLTAITGSEEYWVLLSDPATAIGTIQLNGAWSGSPKSAQLDGVSMTYTHASNSKTAFTDGTYTVRIGTGMEQFFMAYRVAPGNWNLVPPFGGYIPTSGYCVRGIASISTWFLQYSDGATLTTLASAPAAVGTDDSLKVFMSGSYHAAALNGTLLWSVTDTAATSGGFSVGGYNVGTDNFASLSFNDGYVPPNGPLWYTLPYKVTGGLFYTNPYKVK